MNQREMMHIDASHGEGGGQILRTSLALAMLTGTPVTLDHIRAKRSKPGLMRQHLTAVRAAAELCQARLEGDAIGSSRVVFEPGELCIKDYHFKIGTAGSTGLVLQTVLPALLGADAPVTITLEGGTHNPKAPSADFLQAVFAPLLGRIGPRLEVRCEAYGFYPAGGGRLVAELTPLPVAQWQRLELLERGEARQRQGIALVANLPGSIAKREIATMHEQMGWPAECYAIRQESSAGPGNVVMARVDFEHVSELFTAFGEKGKHGDRVVGELVEEWRAYMASGAPVGEHLADQLLLPMALGKGGVFHCSPPSLHARTQAEIIEKFLEVEIGFERVDGKIWRASVAH